MDDSDKKTIEAPVKDDLQTENNETPKKDDSQSSPDELIERYKMQMKWDKESALKAQQEASQAKEIAINAAIAAAKVDGNSLLELAKEYPEIAKEAASKWFSMTLEDVEAQMNRWVKQPEEPVETDEEKFEKWYAKRVAQDQHTSAVSAVSTIFDSIEDETLKQQAKDKFDSLSEGKTLTKEQAVEYAEMATLYVSRGKLSEQAYTSALQWLASSGISKLGWWSAAPQNSKGGEWIDAQGNIRTDSI